MATRVAGDYVETISPKGYVSNREITNLPGHFLVKGSKNTQIKNQEKVVASKRYSLLGAAKDINNPIVSSFDWKTNTKDYRNIRGYLAGRAELEVWYKNVWQRFKNGYQSASFEWIPYWLATEQIDVLIGVNGTDKLFMWSGGIAEVAVVTSNTISKKGFYQTTNLAFNIANRTITDPAANFLTYGFAAGDEITIEGSLTNNGEYTIESVAAGVITLIDTDILYQTETDASNVTVKRTTDGTWAESRFLLATAGRTILIGDIQYTYTGGENTGTLTGLTVNPLANGVINGDVVYQDIMESSPAELADMSIDLVGVLNNQLYVASQRSRTLLISSVNDYTDFTYTSPLRVPGEGFKATLDAAPTAIVPDENDMYISAGDNDWYRITFEFTADQGGESIVIKKLKTAPGQAALNQGAVAYVKNNVAFVSAEKTFDTLGAVENIVSTQNTSISDDIKDDFENYDFTNVHTLYYRRSVFIALPAEGLVLEYDLRFGYWQPPQELPVRRLAIIDGKLCGHSNNSNETYVLFDGYNDNGAPFKAVAAFGYENFGSRFMTKNLTELATEAYLSRNTVLKNKIIYDYKGATAIREFDIDGDDPAITFAPIDLVGLGKDKLGSAPLGGTLAAIDDLVKVRAIDTTAPINFFERQRVFEAEGADIRFEIIAFGENAKMSDNEPAFIKR